MGQVVVRRSSHKHKLLVLGQLGVPQAINLHEINWGLIGMCFALATERLILMHK
ncbi:hypothetical protein MGMO_58c00020 [Methyloglobulus morosus KoM1]|uniref:Uncharacterized protein n=1 Tax=Methyloglobulus morosus KoM1 TaxID=1116472 RepID=V5BGG2_9GAMM|nr:hypothetical protein MGMO_58c00020 [Methyloglobulus morosus KoM1]